MSQKKAKPQEPFLPGGVPKELMDVPKELRLQKDLGNENYSRALAELLDRFATSPYAKSGKIPHQLVFESVHSMIHVLNEVYPRNSQNRPLSVPEVAWLFGAVVGTAAAHSLVHGDVTLNEIEAQVGVFWISLREWLAKGYFAIKRLESSGAASRLTLPGAN